MVLSVTFKLKEKARTNNSIELIFTELFCDPKGFLLTMANETRGGHGQSMYCAGTQVLDQSGV